MAGLRRALVAIAAALALADASVVALALPPILVEFDTTITGVAAIVGVYALVLAVAILPARRLRPGPAGLFVFAAASVGCAVAGSLWLLLVFRALQAAGAAAALLTAFAVLDAGESRAGRRLWLAAALVGTAAGPALGGALTEAFDWRAIFAIQAPLAAAAAVACMGPARAREAVSGETWSEDAELRVAVRPDEPHAPAAGDEPRAAATAAADERRAAATAPPLAPLAALALTVAAFTAVLFLLVIELVAGFAISPLRAALGVSVLPLAALAALAVRGPERPRALAGALLLCGGAAALAFLPAPGLAWTIVPQVLAGFGMGLALPALSRDRDLPDAARNLVARHVGIVVVLAILAPVATARLEDSTERAILQGTSLILDAQIDPLKKLELAPGLLDEVDVDRPRGALSEAVEERRADFASDAAVYDRLAGRLDDVVVVAVQDAFRIAYLIAAALALLAAALLIAGWRRPAVWLAAAAAAGCVVVYAVEAGRRAPPEVALADPCRPRALPESDGITGALQQQALQELDRAACRVGSTREELALALFDAGRAREFEERYGVDPRTTIPLLSLLGG
jgi:MFS family permease